MAKTKKTILVCSLFAAAAVLASPDGIKAFLSDHAKMQRNGFIPGYLDTSVSEHWHTFTSKPSALNDTIVSKTVKFKNNGGVSCYIRASVEFGNSDYDAILENTKNPDYVLEAGGWAKGNDGYYYYAYPVKPGEETEVLFDRVHFGAVKEKYLTEDTAFDIIVNEESVSQRHGDTVFASCQDAWNFHLSNREECDEERKAD